VERRKRSTDKNREVGKRVVRLEAQSVKALESRIDENFSRAVDLIYSSKGRVIVTGLGKSGVIGRKISATLTSTGTASYFLHAAEGSHGDLGIVHREDVVICISKSGETHELQNLIIAFKKLNIPIIAMTGQLDSTLAKESNVVLNVSVKEEACPFDLAPTTSTTATLVMGDALAIALLEKRNFSKEEFAFIHPGGSLGRKLLMTVDDLMEKNESLPHCETGDDMRKVTIEMAHKRGICPIVNEHFMVIGVITTGDLNRLLEQNENFFHLKAAAVMTKNPKIVVAGTLASEALEMMEHFRVVALPVIDDKKKLIGVVHLHDILQAGIRN
jgi:arabinose-5-phosphate isomerase